MSRQGLLTCCVLLLLGVLGIRYLPFAASFGLGLSGLFGLVSILLLSRVSWSRTAANIVFGLNYAFMALVLFGFPLVAAIGVPSGVRLSAFPDAYWSASVFVLFALAILLTLHWSLYLRPFEEHLKLGKDLDASPTEDEVQLGG